MNDSSSSTEEPLWIREEPPPANAGEPESVREAYDALAGKTGGGDTESDG